LQTHPGSTTTLTAETAFARPVVSLDQVTNVPPSIPVSLDDDKNLVGLAEKSADLRDEVRNRVWALTQAANQNFGLTASEMDTFKLTREDFTQGRIFFNQDATSGQWTLYFKLGNGDIMHRVISYGGGGMQWFDYPATYDATATGITGDYLPLAIPGGEEGVVWFHSPDGKVVIPQFVASPKTLADGSRVLTQALHYGLAYEVETWVEIPGTESLAVLPPLPQEFVDQIPKDSYQYDASGLHIKVAQGQVVDIPQDQITERLKSGFYSPVQIYDETGSSILAAYDPENKAWVARESVIQSDMNDTEHFIRADSEAALQEIFRKEKMFLLPFPEDTYWPDAQTLVVDYGKPVFVAHPLGELKDYETRAPLRNGVNFMLWNNNVVYSEQVYNPSDKTFSCFHFFTSIYVFENYYKNFIDADHRNYSLPLYYMKVPSQYTSQEKDQINYYLQKGFYTPGGNTFPEIKKLVHDWLTAGKVPEELEKIPLFITTRDFLSKK